MRRDRNPNLDNTLHVIPPELTKINLTAAPTRTIYWNLTANKVPSIL